MTLGMRRIRHDMSYLLSAGLLVLGTVTATTGLVSDLWDLNDFVYHKYAAYTLAVLALVHVYLHWGRLVAYARWRLGKARPTRKGGHSRARPEPCPEPIEEPSSALGAALRTLLSRRGFVGLTLGSLGGFALGRGLRPQPALPYGGDVGTIYHEWSKPRLHSLLEWSKPRLRSLLGRVANWGRQPHLYKEYAWDEQLEPMSLNTLTATSMPLSS